MVSYASVTVNYLCKQKYPTLLLMKLSTGSPPSSFIKKLLGGSPHTLLNINMCGIDWTVTEAGCVCVPAVLNSTSMIQDKHIVTCQGGGVSSKTHRHGTDKTWSLQPFSPLEKVDF